MRLQNLVSLIGGELKNQPAITQVTGFSTSLAKLKRGALFFAKDKSQVPQAIKLGAYAIVYEGWIQIQDEEIAWIKVQNLQNAVIKLLRFILIQNQSLLFEVSAIALEYAKSVIIDSKCTFLNDPFSFFEKYEQQPYIFTTKTEAHSLAIDTVSPPKPKIKIIQKLPFTTTFIWQERFYERLEVSPLFFEEFQEVLGFIEQYDLISDFEKVKDFPHFKPHFIDGSFRVVEFGKSDRVIITEPDCALLEKEATFLHQIAPWAKRVQLTINCNVKNFAIIDIAKLPALLHHSDFTYALVQDFDITLLEKKQEQKTLL